MTEDSAEKASKVARTAIRLNTGKPLGEVDKEKVEKISRQHKKAVQEKLNVAAEIEEAKENVKNQRREASE